MTIKIAFIGKPEMGKTTIKKVLFEGADPNKLVLFPLEATITRKWTIHEFMDTKIILLDTPGQKLQMLLKDEEEQNYSFSNTNSIIYIFDYPTWIDHSEDVVEDIRCIYEIKKKHEFEANIILFLHKIDLIIAKKIGLKLEIIRKQINKFLNLPEKLPFYFTSLHPNLIYTIYNAVSNIIGDFSEEISALKRLIKNSIKDLSKTICLFSNQDDNLIFQEFSNDFDTNLLHNLYERIYKLTKLNLNSLPPNLITLDSKILHLVIEDISGFYSDIKNIIILSETLEKNELFIFIDRLKKGINLETN